MPSPCPSWLQAALHVAKDAKAQLAKEAVLAGRDLAAYLSHKFECATCHAALPTAHLLSCHVSELHDSFFAAQAARRMRVRRRRRLRLLFVCVMLVLLWLVGEGVPFQAAGHAAPGSPAHVAGRHRDIMGCRIEAGQGLCRTTVG